MKSRIKLKKNKLSKLLCTLQEKSIINQNELFNQTKSKKRNYEH
jgi:hypothetical protein